MASDNQTEMEDLCTGRSCVFPPVGILILVCRRTAHCPSAGQGRTPPRSVVVGCQCKMPTRVRPTHQLFHGGNVSDRMSFRILVPWCCFITLSKTKHEVHAGSYGCLRLRGGHHHARPAVSIPLHSAHQRQRIRMVGSVHPFIRSRLHQRLLVGGVSWNHLDPCRGRYPGARTACERFPASLTDPFVQDVWDWPAANDNNSGTLCHSDGEVVGVTTSHRGSVGDESNRTGFGTDLCPPFSARKVATGRTKRSPGCACFNDWVSIRGSSAHSSAQGEGIWCRR